MHMETQKICLVNPARAGMIRCPVGSVSPFGRKPRASGDDPGKYSPPPGVAA